MKECANPGNIVISTDGAVKSRSNKSYELSGWAIFSANHLQEVSVTVYGQGISSYGAETRAIRDALTKVSSIECKYVLTAKAS